MVEAAVLLVAGVGSRLRPITDTRPKALAPVGGETILGRAVRLLLDFGVSRLILATGYRQDAVRSALGGLACEVVLCPNPRYDTTQNSVSLALCREAVGGRSFFKLDGDVVFDPELLERIAAGEAELVAGVDSGRKLDAEAMKVVVSGERIVRFGKAVPLAASHGESIGIERISAGASTKLFEALDERITAGVTDLYYEDVYSQMIERGELSASAADVSGLRWTEVDTFEDLETARKLFGSPTA
ncbi:MAG TPA: phosphocholine cytidylyltransferase family protein [Polyangiaceae bacterium]|nr:phosphocholine cytidylyltransferase family protein [Polyangiaceae bacterium]